MWHDHMWNGPWMMGWGGVTMVLFWVILIGLAVFLIRSFMGHSGVSEDDSALQTLKERLARGDIDQQEFDTLFNKIKNSH
ncbi:SHOCT domain-containing protein [Marinobacter sp. tcs-11]|mgnify:FL=1|uniref:SHOCT domain-containing protein n=1 Tax=unclassified Marinobacter TaxID=83889 RepID=UPI000C57EEAB|nr:SHOCT domain-containing protein [Marinobacter sp. tcs-11]MBE93918.1 hypothetical protein [Marinobacter sp.]